MIAITPHPDGASLAVLAYPGSRRVGILGERAGALRIGVAAPPEKEKPMRPYRPFLLKFWDAKPARSVS